MKISELKNIVKNALKELQLNENIVCSTQNIDCQCVNSLPSQGNTSCTGIRTNYCNGGYEDNCKCCGGDSRVDTPGGGHPKFTSNHPPVPQTKRDLMEQSSWSPDMWSTGSYQDYINWYESFYTNVLGRNNPCNFLNQRYNQFGNQLQQGGMGPLQTNLTYQKFSVVH